jgi:septum site-determining protein MinD
MAQIITVNAFHQGAGVSTLAANVAVVLAQRGQRVGLLDACISAPTQHLLFDIRDSALPPTFNDFLLGHCDLVDAARALPADSLLLRQGELFLVPADSDWGKIQNALQAPCGVEVLGPGFHRLADALRLDTLVIDSEGDLGESVLASIAMSDHVLAVVQLDQQYYKGLGVALGLAGHLDIPHRSLVVNSASPSFEPETVRQTVEQRYGWPVAGIVPYCDELSALCSSAIFVVRYPNHPVSTIFRQIADTV